MWNKVFGSKVTFYMKSGNSFSVRLTDVVVTYEDGTGNITGVKVVLPKVLFGKRIFMAGLIVSQIEAILV